MLKIENISTGYEKTQIIFDFSMVAEPNEIVLVAGSNGSGKSTLMKCIAGQLRVWNDGQLDWNGINMKPLPASERLRNGIMYVPQHHKLFEDMTVAENLQLAGNALKGHNAFQQALSNSLNALPELKALRKTLAVKLSGGERQLLALGMVMLYEPKLLLLDEPLAGLSAKSAGQTLKVIGNLRKQYQTCIIMIEHRLPEALAFADKLIGLKLGKKFCEHPVGADFDLKQLNTLFI